MNNLNFRVVDGTTVKYFSLTDALNWLNDGDVFKSSKNRKIQQSTGLPDKNGKEIYQGDTVKFAGSHPNYPWNVVWAIDTAEFKLADSADDAYWKSLSEVYDIEIIGFKL